MAFACLHSILSDFCLSLNSSDLHKEDLDEEAHILRPRLDRNGIRLKFNEKTYDVLTLFIIWESY